MGIKPVGYSPENNKAQPGKSGNDEAGRKFDNLLKSETDQVLNKFNPVKNEIRIHGISVSSQTADALNQDVSKLINAFIHRTNPRIT